MVKTCSDSVKARDYLNKAITIGANGDVTIDGAFVGKMTNFGVRVHVKGEPKPVQFIKSSSGEIIQY